MNMITRAAALAALLIPGAIVAKDGPQWNHDPETSAWFKSLHNDNGTSCCDYADGVRLEAVDWRENDDGTFMVFAKGQWIRIEKHQLVKGANRVGYAILWWPENWPMPSCFLPGARG